jgi:hypothetical protein
MSKSASPFTGIFAVDPEEKRIRAETLAAAKAKPAAECDCPWSAWHRTQQQRAVQAAARAEVSIIDLRSEVERLRIFEKTGSKPRRKAIIPALKPHTIHRFLCAIPRAVAAGELSAAQGNGLLYAAQVFISLLKSTTPHPPPPALGFSNPNPKGTKK